jgi:hypothetical protein
VCGTPEGVKKWHAPSPFDILKWSKAVNTFMAFEQGRITGRRFHSFLKPLAKDMFTPSTWSGTHIETLWERRKTSPNPESGGAHRRNEATLEQCSTLR